MKTIKTLVIILLLGFIGYEHSAPIAEQLKIYWKDPAEHVLNANVPADEIVYSFDSKIHGKIYLQAGIEENYGLRHILARHTQNYFINFKNKNNATMFDSNISGRELIYGLEKFYQNCVDVVKYNNKIERNSVYIGYTRFRKDGDYVKCLLVVRTESNEIVTFYPIDETEEFEQKVLEPIEEDFENLIEEEKDFRKNYFYD